MNGIRTISDFLQLSFSRVFFRALILPILILSLVMIYAPNICGQLPTGNGSGEFLPPVFVPLSESSLDMTVADLNEDGLSDIVVAKQFSNEIQVLLADDDGSFDDTSISGISIPEAIMQIYSGFCNGDGDEDLLVLTSDDNFYLLSGNGRGDFDSPELVYSHGNPIDEIATGDLNGDGQLDLVVSAYCGLISCPETRIVLNDGNGNLNLLSALLPPAFDLLIADIDSDGNQDLLLETQLGTLQSYLNDGLVNFTLLQEIDINYEIDQMFLAEVLVDSTGEFDVIDLICSADGGESLAFLIGEGDGVFDEPSQGYSNQLDSAIELCPVQLDGEGTSDLVFCNMDTEELVIFIGNNGQDGLPYSVDYFTYSVPNNPTCVQIADFNSDDVLDVVVASSSEDFLAVYFGIKSPDDFRRGDANGDEIFNIADPITTLEALFFPGGSISECSDAFDANDDGAIDVSDAVHSLAFLFGGTGSMAAPFPDCGSDPTPDALDCLFSLGSPACP